MIKKILGTIAIMMGMLMMTPVMSVSGATEFFEACDPGGASGGSQDLAGCDEVTNSSRKAGNVAQDLIQFAIGAVGIGAVVVVVFAGQRLVTSSGDPGKIKQAKDMLLYGLIAVVVSLLAYAIVSFVSGAVTS